MNQQTPPCWQVAEHIDTGRLIRVLAPFERPPAPIQALFAPGRPLPPKFAPLQISWWRVERHRRSNARSSWIDRHHAVRHDEALFGLFSAQLRPFAEAAQFRCRAHRLLRTVSAAPDGGEA